MERRPGEQRLKLDEGQRRRAHVYGHGIEARYRHGSTDHLHDPLTLDGQGQARGQIHPLHQHHGEPGEGLRQQVPRVDESREGVAVSAHGQGDGPIAAALVAPADEPADGADGKRQQAQAVDKGPEGHGAQEYAPGPGAGPAQGQQEQPAPQQQRRGEQGQQRPPILLPAYQQGRDQQAAYPPRQAQEPGPLPEGKEVPERPQQRHRPRPPGPQGHAAQCPGEPQQQPIHGEVVQQKPFQTDPHATSTTSTVMSSCWPRRWAAAMSSSAMRSRG